MRTRSSAAISAVASIPAPSTLSFTPVDLPSTGSMNVEVVDLIYSLGKDETCEHSTSYSDERCHSGACLLLSRASRARLKVNDQSLGTRGKR